MVNGTPGIGVSHFLCNACDNSFVIPNIVLIKCKQKTKLNDCIDSNKLVASYLCSEIEPSSTIISSTSITDENMLINLSKVM